MNVARKYRTAFEGYRHFLITEAGITPVEASKLLEQVDAILQHSFNQDGGGPGVAYFASSPNLPTRFTGLADQPSNFMPVQGRPTKDTIARNFSLIDSEGRLSGLITLLKSLEPRLTDIRLSEPYGETILSGRIDGKLIPLPLMGEGVNRVAHIALTMMSDEFKYVFIDEIENGIHFSVQSEVWKAIGEVSDAMDIQVFATTHSYEMIQAAHEAFKDEDPYEFRFHRLNRNSETGDIEAVTYNEAGVNAFTSISYEVRG